MDLAIRQFETILRKDNSKKVCVNLGCTNGIYIVLAALFLGSSIYISGGSMYHAKVICGEKDSIGEICSSKLTFKRSGEFQFKN